MRVRWTAEARSDLVRLHAFLASVNPPVAARVVQTLRAAPARLTITPRLGPRMPAFAPREVRRLFVGDYELRYEIQGTTIIVLNLWHMREDR
jgi:plasmid stabilization system protein ParE